MTRGRAVSAARRAAAATPRASRSMTFTVLIPARYASTRLPGKPLADIAGKPMVVRVAERAQRSGAARVVVATDDERIARRRRGARHRRVPDARRPSDRHRPPRRGRARARARRRRDRRQRAGRRAAARARADPRDGRRCSPRIRDAAIATACHPIDDAAEAFNPNVVKVVLDARGYALYFSRATIPWARDAFAATRDALPAGLPLYRHYGLYAYRVGVPARVSGARAGAARALRGARAAARAVARLPHRRRRSPRGTPAPGVDTPEDLERVRAHLRRRRECDVAAR